jgi:hypothetical protein
MKRRRVPRQLFPETGADVFQVSQSEAVSRAYEAAMGVAVED